jgi:ferredoxin-2, mitochondrial
MLKGMSRNRILVEIARCRKQYTIHTKHQQLYVSCLSRIPIHACTQQRPSIPSMIHNAAVRWHGDSSVPHDAPTVNVTFQQPDGTTHVTVPARIGESLLETAHRNAIDLEGACEGVCACSTCHLILPQAIYDTLPESSENEEDMLDMAFGLTTTSRLGCQIKVTPEMDGVVFEMPKATRNFYVDGHKPKPH